MVDKKRKGKGLIDPPNIKGVDDLFGVDEPTTNEAKQTNSKKSASKSSGQSKLHKTSFSLSEDTQELLYDLKRMVRKREGRFVSLSEIVERGLVELAKQYELVVEEEK